MIFVSGGTGLLGRHLLIELAQDDVKITAIYRDATKIERVEACFKYYLKEKAADAFKKIQWKFCDLLNTPELYEAMHGHDEVYHCAGLISFHKHDSSKMMQVNRYGTANMVDAALKLNAAKFCFVSSVAAVGNKDIPAEQEVDENGKWILNTTTSGYGISKYSAEKEVWRGMEEGLNAVIVNPGIIFGAGDASESSLSMISSLKHRQIGYPTGSTAFVDARDVARVMVQLMDRELFHQRFICVGENASYATLFTLIADKVGKKIPQRKIARSTMEVAWRLAVLWGIITLSKSKLTKEIVQSAFETIKYSNKKVKTALDYQFYTLEEAVDNVLRFQKQ